MSATRSSKLSACGRGDVRSRAAASSPRSSDGHGPRGLLRLFHRVLLFGQPPTPCRFSQRSHAAMTMRAIASRSRGSLTNSGIVNAAAVPSSRTSGTVRHPVSRSNSNEPYDQCSVPGMALMASVTMPLYPAGASRNRYRASRAGPRAPHRVRLPRFLTFTQPRCPGSVQARGGFRDDPTPVTPCLLGGGTGAGRGC
jgi:hypothetical protein